MENDFVNFVNQIISRNHNLVQQRTTVEKEVFHHDILVAISESEFGDRLVFMGGTCLRLCYGAERLSEDLDFCTDILFSENEIIKLGNLVKSTIYEKYKYNVEVTHPEKDTDTDTWVVKIITHPESAGLPSQKIHLDICHYPSVTRQIRLVRNNYEIGMVSNQLYFNVETLEEIVTDKLVAFAFRNRIKNRDLWDLVWLNERGVKSNKELLIKKLNLRNKSYVEFSDKFNSNLQKLNECVPDDFFDELTRFVPSNVFKDSILSSSKANSVIVTVLSDYINF